MVLTDGPEQLTQGTVSPQDQLQLTLRCPLSIQDSGRRPQNGQIRCLLQSEANAAPGAPALPPLVQCALPHGPSFPYQDDPVRQALHELHLVRAEEHRRAGGPELPDQIKEELLVQRV